MYIGPAKTAQQIESFHCHHFKLLRCINCKLLILYFKCLLDSWILIRPRAGPVLDLYATRSQKYLNEWTWQHRTKILGMNSLYFNKPRHEN